MYIIGICVHTFSNCKYFKVEGVCVPIGIADIYPAGNASRLYKFMIEELIES